MNHAVPMPGPIDPDYRRILSPVCSACGAIFNSDIEYQILGVFKGLVPMFIAGAKSTCWLSAPPHAGLRNQDLVLDFHLRWPLDLFLRFSTLTVFCSTFLDSSRLS